MDVILFLIFAIIAVVCAINVVVQTHPISSAISLVGVMGSLAVLYLLLGAEFIAAAQVIVYAGAVMVLFIFVIMLLNAGAEVKKGRSFMVQLLGVPLLVGLLILLAFFVQRLYPVGTSVHFGGFTGGSARDVGRALFTTYLLPFEVTSILILIAIVGAIVLARKELE
jgi:NADH-quinone oxidoreductase subunit J